MSTVRQHLLQQRKSLSITTKLEYDGIIAATLKAQTAFINANHIACYHAYAGEVATTNIIADIRQQGKLCYLPNITSTQSLVFSQLLPDSKMLKDKHGIVEIVDQEKYLANELELMIIPLVGFDAACNRIGWGHGYYDRCLSFLKPVDRPTNPILIGLAYERQQLDNIETQAWDVPLDSIITEKNIYRQKG